MNQNSHQPEDNKPADDSTDPDKPIDLPTAADHRPDQGADGSQRPPTDHEDSSDQVRDQYPLTSMPHPSRLHKLQRSPHMNTEKSKGRER